jgi:alpha-tubulin suppressor-like RCC1 family protein
MKKVEPQVVAQLRSSRITSIACGAAHVLCLKSDGQVVSFGCPTYGRLGRRAQSAAVEKGFFDIGPIVFPDLKDPISQIACGHQHNLALTESGAVYSWGRALHGQVRSSFQSTGNSNPHRLACYSLDTMATATTRILYRNRVMYRI